MKAGVIVFPGSNCDRDVAVAIERVSGTAPQMLWHGDTNLPDGIDLVVLPGGFTFGDYLRSGAISARSPIMRAVAAAAERGVTVFGVCNGFQILTEAGLLPGALMRNAELNYLCRDVALTVGTTDSPFTSRYRPGEALTIPIAHNDGNYTADEATLDRLEGEDRVAFRYAGPVNGSARGIAGVIGGPRRNILGMMPHPERMIEQAHGGDDGRRLFESMIAAVG